MPKISSTMSAAEVHELVSLEFAGALTQRMGYIFPSERARRIADEARLAISEGMPPAHAYAHALDLELVMHGDPHCKDELIGLVNPKIKERRDKKEKK